MIRCKSTIRGRSLALLLIPVTAVLLAGAMLPSTASAQAARVWDTITGDPVTPLEWSEGVWMMNDQTIGCTTFPGGVATGPGSFELADSVDCAPPPNHWMWSVVIPGPFTLEYDIHGIPPGITVCGQVFGASGMSGIVADVDLTNDWMEVRNRDNGEMVWQGRFSSFHPGLSGPFTSFGATRCGVYELLPPGACCNLETGQCFIMTEFECNQQSYAHLFFGEGSVCEPNPCPPPVPADRNTWGSIKKTYR